MVNSKEKLYSLANTLTLLWLLRCLWLKNSFHDSEIVYTWELLDSEGVPVPGVNQNISTTLTGWDKESLVLNAGILATQTEYQIRLSAHYEKSKPVTKTVITLARTTSIPPLGGKCVITWVSSARIFHFVNRFRADSKNKHTQGRSGPGG